ncbi:MAG: ribosomal protein S18-alanine N-acetyltransferase [Acidimicrobiales bacterium]
MPAALFIESARAAHVHDMRRIDSIVYRSPWSVDLWRRELARPASEACYVAASVANGHVGHAGLLVQAGDGHVVTVAVDPERRRLGIATQLMLVLARRAVALGLDALTLEVRAGNQPAQSLYRQFGFGPAGVRPGYYADDGEDALIMWAHGVSEPAYTERLDGLVEEVGDCVIKPSLDRLMVVPHREDAHS